MKTIEESKKQWVSLVRFSGILAFIVVALTLLDIIFGSINSSDLTELPSNAIERFSEFYSNPILGLYHLDLLNVTISIVYLPVFFALVVVHQQASKAFAYLAFALFLVASSIFVSSNTALPMLELSRKYHLANSELERNLYAAAGEALLARGAHGTPGVFIGFMMLTISNICISWVMVIGGVFHKVVGYVGLFGGLCLAIYLVLLLLFPKAHQIGVAIAAPGGILVLAWYVLIGLNFLRFETKPTTDV